MGREDEFYCKVANPAHAEEIQFRLHLAMTDYDGREFDWTSDVLQVAPGKSIKVPMARVVKSMGWFRLQPAILSADSDKKVGKPIRQLAYINPVGPCELPPADGFWFGLDSRVRTPDMLRLLSQMGVNIVRFGTWARVNPDEGSMDFDEFDRVVDAMRGYKMQPLYSVTFTPSFAVKPEYRSKGDSSRLPPRPEALRESLRKIIAHTRDKGATVYDLWNEPDHRGFWRGTTDDYLEFMRVAFEAIKSVQPDATVLSGGIASLHPSRSDGLNPDMDRRIVLEGNRWYDALALHEHGPFDRFVKALDGPLAEYRRTLKEYKPLWFTETGHNGDGREKAAVLVKKITYARARGARGLVWYALYPPGQGGKYNIIDGQGDPQPVIPAYCHMVRMMRGKRFSREFEDRTQAGNYLFAFEGDSQTLLIAWGQGATEYQASIQVAHGAKAKAFDIMGRQRKLERSSDTAFLPFDSTPRYLIVEGKAEVDAYEPIVPLALFTFGDFKPSVTAAGVVVSPLEAIGWKRLVADDEDTRMAKSTSGNPNCLLDGSQKPMHLHFKISPMQGASLDVKSLGFWGNGGAFGGTTVTLAYRIGDGSPVEVGSRPMQNLSSPRTKGEYYRYPLGGLTGVKDPITFTLTTSGSGERVILKLDDIRVDGTVRK
jgi:hypothetical protein